jgi:hypothetical protein
MATRVVHLVRTYSASGIGVPKSMEQPEHPLRGATLPDHCGWCTYDNIVPNYRMFPDLALVKGTWAATRANASVVTCWCCQGDVLLTTTTTTTIKRNGDMTSNGSNNEAGVQ